MKKLVSSLSLLTLSFAAVAANAQDPECNGNGTLVGTDSRGLWCELPTDITTSGTYHLAKTSSYAHISGAPILWVLPEIVLVGNGHLPGATPSTVDNTEVVIDAGARIVGGSAYSALVITRGAKLTANGTANDPIIFSSMDEDYSGKGEWGGVILSGFGEANECPGDTAGCLMEGIALDDFYYGGGVDTNHSSGSLEHVVISEGGSVVDMDGLTLYAVNDSTTLENIHIHDNLNDGIQFFGGDVDTDNLWLTCNQDDSVDWDDGYQGTVDGLSIVQKVGYADPDHAFEMSNNSNGSVLNATIQLIGGVSDYVFRSKGGSGYFNNVLLQGYSGVGCSWGGATFGSQIEYDCDNSNGALPASTSASGFYQPTFWTTALGNPGCN